MKIFNLKYQIIVKVLFVIIFLFTTPVKSLDKFDKADRVSNYFSGVLLLFSDEYSESYRYLKKLDGLESSHRNYASKYLFSLINLGKFNEAEASYTQAITLMPNYCETLYNRGLLLFDKAQYEAALIDADACESRKATTLSLISLHALGCADEIYKRLEFQSKSDAENISVAAFAAFMAAVDKKPNVYNFCPNHLVYIYLFDLLIVLPM